MRILILLAGAMTLAGCITDRQITDNICTRQIVTRLGAEAALKKAETTVDPVKRQLLIDGANATLALLDRCPPIGAN